ncbi:MAG: ABC transporter ATP-binding protein [Bradymonadales bacterium]|nr:MAG: ABC transporter ATP-binding protein [Bradymonadales bacterium]
MKVLEVQALSKIYRQHFWTKARKVLDAVSFSVHQGEIFGFLGPNGAGKSTTIKILLEIIFPSSGEARLFGQPIHAAETKQRIGFLAENPYFYDFLTAQGFLEFHGGLYGLSQSFLRSRIPEVLELVGMKGTENIRLRFFSKGMLQRIGLAQAIIHDPDLVILDEPMTGLDPVGRKEVRDLMIELKSRGKTVFFSTHILSDVESICDRVAILNLGKLLSCGNLNELVSVDSKYVDLVLAGTEGDLTKWAESHQAELIHKDEYCCYRLWNRQENSGQFEARINSALRAALSAGARVHSLNHKKDNLEDVFMKQVGQLESRV